MFASPNLTTFRDKTIQIKKMFHLILIHLHHLLITMPVLHLPVPENQFPIDKDNFTFVKINIEKSLEYMELPDMLLNKKLDPLIIMDLHFAAFKNLVPILDLQSQFLFQVFRPRDDDDGGLKYIKVPPIFQAEVLCPLSLQEPSTMSCLVIIKPLKADGI